MCLSFLTHFFTGVILKIYMEIESNSSSLLETIDIQDCTLLSIQNEFNVTVDDSLDDFETIDYYFFYTDEQYQVLVFLRSLKAGFSSIFDGIYSRNFSIPYSAPPFFFRGILCRFINTLQRPWIIPSYFSRSYSHSWLFQMDFIIALEAIDLSFNYFRRMYGYYWKYLWWGVSYIMHSNFYFGQRKKYFRGHWFHNKFV